MNLALKNAKSANEQIALLKSRGLEVDPPLAKQWLANVSYYRLSGYWYPARAFDKSTGRRLDRFAPGFAFQNATDLYEADRKLRTLLHDGVERVEIALRTQVTDHLCNRHPSDPTFYLTSEAFRDEFDHLTWIHRIYGRLRRSSSHSEPVKHYKKNYSGNYPLWVAAEVMDFSDISILYTGLEYDDQLAIAKNLGFSLDTGELSQNQRKKLPKGHPLANWIHQLTIIRNTCAHHGRLWNKSFKPVSINGLRGNGNLCVIGRSQSERVFDAIVVMSHILRKVSPGTSWPDKVLSLINKGFLPNPLVEPSSLGIPETWDRKTI
ncbi:Abi family protein [Corynebacterium urealyticum]|uniref:Abi family protein n=1 Tax=Corynebacterium urealyticum TaxID=43771 RepID=UPI00293EDE2B|nr:Abi family protein [Corynebacterium urealyticum]WOH94170.1 Abi family protein [Corynebacterium urealyticum]